MTTAAPNPVLQREQCSILHMVLDMKISKSLKLEKTPFILRYLICSIWLQVFAVVSFKTNAHLRLSHFCLQSFDACSGLGEE